MKELTFAEASLIMEKGDIFQPENEYLISTVLDKGGEFRLTKESCGRNPRTSDYFKTKGHIIKAERVLMDDELINSHEFECRNDYISFCKRCHKNGRLERDLELRPLIEAAEKCVKNWRDHGHSGLDHSLYELKKALESIPPLKKEEKG